MVSPSLSSCVCEARRLHLYGFQVSDNVGLSTGMHSQRCCHASIQGWPTGTTSTSVN